MSKYARAALCAAVLGGSAGCDDTAHVDGARGPCLGGGQIFETAFETALDPDPCREVVSIEDACWKLVDCGVFPLDHQDEGGLDWGRCVDRLEGYDADTAAVAIACIDATSCDGLVVNDSPHNPYEWPDCLEYR